MGQRSSADRLDLSALAPELSQSLLVWREVHGRKAPDLKPWMFTKDGRWPEPHEHLSVLECWIADDSRQMNTGNADTSVNVTDKRDVFFSQLAAGLEAVSDTWYALVPIGDVEKRLNSHYNGGALDTYGLDVGYSITPDWDASIGYYYQHGDDLTEDDGSGVLAQLSYEISSGLTLGVNLSYDEAFDTRVSGNIEYRFGSNTSSTTTEKKAWKTPVIQSLTESIKHRDVRVHDANKITKQPCQKASDYAHVNRNNYHCTITHNGKWHTWEHT